MLTSVLPSWVVPYFRSATSDRYNELPMYAWNLLAEVGFTC